MRVTIVGIKPVSFTPKNADHEISGQTVFYEFEGYNTFGVQTDKCFLSDRKAFEEIPSLPCEADIFYNKYGKVEAISLVK